MASPHALQVLFLAAASGDEKAVTKMLAQDPPLFDATNAKTALTAGGSGHEGSNYTHLDWAAQKGHRNLVVQILTKWPDLISIHDAAKGGYDEVLNVVFSRKPQFPWSQNRRSRTVLIAAVIGGHESTVALLLAKDPELIHIVNPNLETALQCTKKVSIAKQLLDHKPELIDAVDPRGRTALHSVILYDSMEMLDFLLERRPELSDAVDAGHQNALHFAVHRGHKEAVFKLLAQNPRSIDVVTSQNKNILHIAAEADNLQLLDTILSLRPGFACGVDASGNTALHCLFQSWGHHYIAESHWEKIWELNPSALRAVNNHSQTPSMIAIGRGFLREKELSLTQKLSWDELIADHEALKLRRRDLSEKLNRRLQISRKFAEEQCESGLSSALFIPGVIDIVKSYTLLTQEVENENEPSVKRYKGEDDDIYWHWGNYGDDL